MAIAFQVVVNSSAVPDISSLISGGSPAFFKGRITFSSTTFIADGFTNNPPSQSEQFQFGGTGTTYVIQSATSTGTSGE